MNELVYKDEVFQLVGVCMEIHPELGKGHEGVILPHYYYADFVVWDKILFEAKAVEKLTDSHIKQSAKLSRRFEASARPVGQFRWGFLGMEKGHFMRHETRISRAA